MKKLLIAIALITGLSSQAQDIKKSNWQMIETDISSNYANDVYYFEITASTIRSTDKRGIEDFGTYEISKLYNSGTVSFIWTVLNEEFIEYRYKDSFTGKYIIKSYQIK